MAAKANESRVRADIRPPDYRAAVAKIRGIEPKKTRIGELNGEIGDIWAKVEGHKVNKKAAKTFRALDRMEGPERADFMRSLNGLCDAAGWPKEESDLVDGAQGKVVQMRVGAEQDNEAPDEPDGEEEKDEDSDPPRSARRSSVAAGLDSLERARARMGGGRAGAAPPA